MKPVLLVRKEDYTSFDHPWVNAVISQWFNIETYDPDKTYDPKHHAVNITYTTPERSNWFEKLEQQGFKIVVDHLWDSDVVKTTHCQDNRLIVHCPNWMWYLAGWEFAFHGYETYRPQRNPTYNFFMPMNNPRWHRDLALERLAPLLNNALYSYNCQGIKMPGDGDRSLIGVPWQRYMNPVWYDRSAFSVVSESYMRTASLISMGTEVSEKIFKPLSYYHPFVTFSSQHTLKYLHEQGFETFPELFDESYDLIFDDRERHQRVCNTVFAAVDRWQRGEFEITPAIAQKFEHNHQHVFNHKLTVQRFYNEVVVDILEYLES